MKSYATGFHDEADPVSDSGEVSVTYSETCAMKLRWTGILEGAAPRSDNGEGSITYPGTCDR